MRLHFLQHVEFEGPSYINTWAYRAGLNVSRTAFFADEPLPALDKFDWLVVLGGPMSVYDETQYPWLIKEKLFIERAIAAGKKVLGLCLGAQLIAEVLGARVYKNSHKEIGWFEVSKTPEGQDSKVLANFPDRFWALHWHSDTFDLPPGAARIASSQACQNQAFEFGENVVGMQFHLEFNIQSITSLISNCEQDLCSGKFVQNAEHIVSGNDKTSETRDNRGAQCLQTTDRPKEETEGFQDTV